MRGVMRGVMRGARLPPEGDYTPLLLNGPLWLSPQDASTITLNGSDVSDIADKSGNGNDFAQTTAVIQPLYNTTGINGRNTITCVHANDEHLLNTNFVHNTGTGDFYFAGLGFVTDNTLRNGLLYFRDADKVFFWSDDTADPEYGTSAENKFSSLAMVNDTNYAMEFWRDGTSVRCRQNGTLDTDSQINTNSHGGTETRLRYPSTEFGVNWGGDIGDCMFLPSLPSQSLRDQNRDYLMNEWGI